MNIPEVCITFIAALLGVAYPILLEVVSRLDEKYSSLLIVNLFKNEKEWTLFRTFLSSSLIGVLIYIVINLPFLPFAIPTAFSYTFLVVFIISTILLIVTFLFFVKKVVTYYSPNQVLQYFNRQKENEEHTYFQATTDILHLSIKNQDTVTARTASEFIYKNFRNVRLLSANKPVQYPDVYYQMVFKTIQELVFSNNERFTYLEHRSLGGVWFLGEHEKAKIHEHTFSWMWRGLVFSVGHKKDDMIMQYWSVAHQHFIYELALIHPEHVGQGSERIIQNAQAIDSRNTDRERFLEFNYALGGLLLYQGRHNLISRMFRYTTSIPKSFDLLPLSMSEVFNLYFKFRDPYDYNFPFIGSRYYFPNAEGIHGEGIVKHWVCKYAALLFLRQYTIIPHYSFMAPMVPPDPPESQSEKRIWIENLDYFKQLVNEVLNDAEILLGVGLEYVNENWFSEQGKTHPDDFIDSLKKSVNKAFDDTEQNQPISETKKQAFYDQTKSIIQETIIPYKIAFNKVLNGDTKSWHVPSINMVAEKSAFSDNQDVSHTNFDTFLAGRHASRIKKAISETFHSNETDSYLLKSEDLFTAIDKLSLDPNKYIIVNFGIDLNYQVHYSKVPGLSEKAYKTINILSFGNYNRALMNPSFFILKKEDLPQIILKPINEDVIQKYSLEQIDENLQLYASVIDINANQAIREELETEQTHTSLNKSVLMYIGLNLEIKWKKSLKMLSLAQYSEFNNRGLPNELIDVKFSG